MERMTEQEAIMQIQAIPQKIWEQLSETDNEAGESRVEMAFKALEEIQHYREIGTPEECQAAVKVKKEITEVVNRQLIAGRNNYKETNNCFYEIAKIIQDNY